MFDCAVVIVTFFPDQRSIKTIKTYAAACSFVVVVDNTPQNSSVEFPEADNLLVVQTGFPADRDGGIYLSDIVRHCYGLRD